MLSYRSLESIPGPLKRLKICALNSDLAFMITTNLTFILQSSLKNEFMGRDGWKEANARISQGPPLVSSSSENVVSYKLGLSLNVTIKKLVNFSFCFLNQILLIPLSVSSFCRFLQIQLSLLKIFIDERMCCRNGGKKIKSKICRAIIHYFKRKVFYRL